MNNIQATKPKKSTKHAGGRPTVMTPEVLAKLEQAFAIDATVEEALSYAEIKRDAYYDYLKRNPKFSDRITDLRQRPILKARQTIVKGLDDPKNAQWYLERKKKIEFSSKTEVDLNNPDGNLKTIIINKHGSDDKPLTQAI